jgi:hypothetical protein
LDEFLYHTVDFLAGLLEEFSSSLCSDGELRKITTKKTMTEITEKRSYLKDGLVPHEEDGLDVGLESVFQILMP